MSANSLEATGLILLAAAMNASYTLPMKLNRRWSWEHSWFAFTLTGVLLTPLAIALWTVPNLWAVYGNVPYTTLLNMGFFGAAWGVSMVLFGRAVALVGVAMTFSTSLATSAAVGALVPLLSRRPDRLFTREGLLILCGISAIVAGVVLCGAAGRIREKKNAGPLENRFRLGFSFALGSGVLGSMLNLGLAFGGDIQQAALRQGASTAMMSNAVWIPCLAAGTIPGLLYCLYLMRRNRNLAQFRAESRTLYWAMTSCMGILWFGSIVLYSIATVRLGDMGPSIGWPLFLSAIVVASSIAGFLGGEWSGAAPKATRLMAFGVLSLVVAIGILSQAGSG